MLSGGELQHERPKMVREPQEGGVVLSLTRRTLRWGRLVESKVSAVGQVGECKPFGGLSRSCAPWLVRLHCSDAHVKYGERNHAFFFSFLSKMRSCNNRVLLEDVTIHAAVEVTATMSFVHMRADVRYSTMRRSHI